MHCELALPVVILMSTNHEEEQSDRAKQRLYKRVLQLVPLDLSGGITGERYSVAAEAHVCGRSQKASSLVPP